MIAPIKFDIDRLRGREALHFTNYKGNFAFSERLKPTPTGGTLTIYSQYPKDSDLFAGGFLHVLTGKDVTFTFGSPSDPRFCEADFVFLHSNKTDYLLGGKTDPWEVLLSVAWNTPWVAGLFAEPEGRDEFLQDIWYACYSGVTDIRIVGTYSNWGDNTIAARSLTFLSQALGNKLKKAKFVAIIMNKLRGLVAEADGLVVAPANAQGWGIRYVRQFIQSIAKKPIPVILMKEWSRYLIYPGQTEDAEGNTQDITDFRTVLGDTPKETLAKLGAYSKIDNGTLLISCADKQSAILIGEFLRDAFFGRIEARTLKDVVEVADGGHR